MSAPHPDDLVDAWLTVPDVAERLGTDAGKVRRMLQERRIVGVRRGDPAVLSVPEAFLVPGHLANPAAPGRAEDEPAWTVLAALQGTLTVLADSGFTDDEAVVWLFTPDDALGTTPVAALRAGRKTEVRRIAQALL
ncbi:DNA-binding protein [Cellulomonas sp. JZ18]|uniref:Rv2175c family DNA-binding protein n=1 Tax=Cellulomonas sp. JZ18 TaxID=2654191 RepID=UPI0012D43C87|nr:Rv2175c family DNA-binding protein [Cellulomonas sp. JZ18]QGQ19134.1 DNA-binding protein [Cellulomonas sp. JZ18]